MRVTRNIVYNMKIQEYEKRKIKGGILVIIGYILSPLSWWNDFFINIPLSYVFALPFGFISEKLFIPTMIMGYWITNIIGFLLMHYGVAESAFKKTVKYSKKELIKDVIVSIVYTVIVIIFVLIGWLKFPIEYFS